MLLDFSLSIFFFNDPATTQIYTLSLHDALPILGREGWLGGRVHAPLRRVAVLARRGDGYTRSEEHTSELQSLTNLVCRLLLEKKKQETTPRQRNNAAELAREERDHDVRDIHR